MSRSTLDHLNSATAILAVLISAISLYHTTLYKTDSVQGALISGESGANLSFDLAVVNSGNRPAIISSIKVFYNFTDRAGATPVVRRRARDQQLPVALIPGDLKLISHKPYINPTDLYEFGLEAKNPESHCTNYNGSSKENHVRAIPLYISVSAVDSLGKEHSSIVGEVMTCTSISAIYWTTETQEVKTIVRTSFWNRIRSTFN